MSIPSPNNIDTEKNHDTLTLSIEENDIHNLATNDSDIKSPDNVKQITITTGERDSEQFPEGGRGWFVIFGCMFISFTTFGMINAYGVFQSYYETVLFPGVKSFKLSIIGACQPSIIYLVVPIVIPLVHALGARLVLATGGALMVVGLFGLSTTTTGELWKCYLFQAIIFSLGAGMLFPPVCFGPMEWFKLKRASAIGISSCGVGLGGTVWPLIFKHMINKVGFHWTVRTIAFIYIPLVTCATIFVPQHLPDQFVHKEETIANSKFNFEKVKKLPQTYKRIIKNWLIVGKSNSLNLLLFVNLIGMVGSYPAIFYLDLFATTIGPNAKITPYIVMMYSFMGAPGRVIPAIAADKIGRINVLSSCMLISGVLIFALWVPAIKNEIMALFAVFCVIFGFFLSPLFSLFPACLGQIFGIKGSEDRLFLFFITSAPGPILGSLIAGSFIPVQHHGDKQILLDSFIKLNVFSGVILFVAGLLLVALRLKISTKLTDFI